LRRRRGIGAGLLVFSQAGDLVAEFVYLLRELLVLFVIGVGGIVGRRRTPEPRIVPVAVSVIRVVGVAVPIVAVMMMRESRDDVNAVVMRGRGDKAVLRGDASSRKRWGHAHAAPKTAAVVLRVKARNRGKQDQRRDHGQATHGDIIDPF